MTSPPPSARHLMSLALLVAAEALAAFIALLLLPSEELGAAAFGYSAPRLAALLFLALAALMAGIFLCLLRMRPQNTLHVVARFFERLSAHPEGLLMLLALLWGVVLVASGFLGAFLLGGWRQALFQRLAPPLLFAGLLGGQTLWLVFRSVPFAARRHLAARILAPLLRLLERLLSWLGTKLKPVLCAIGDSRAWQNLSSLFNEPLDYLWIALFFLLVYLLAGLVVPALLHQAPPDFRQAFLQRFFGFSQLRHLGLPLVAAWFTAVGLLALFVYRWRDRALRLVRRVNDALFSSPLYPLLFSLAAGGFFFLLRSHYLNPDALQLEEKILRDVPLIGAHVTHDEMWELYLHSRFWFLTHQWFGWSVYLSYQVLSAAGGAVFTWFLLQFCRLQAPSRAVVLFLLVSSGAFMQLFFGDVENYTLAAACIMAYFYFSARYLRGRARLELVSAVLALAMTFHLLAGFLLPSLAYLMFQALRQRQDSSFLRSLLVFIAVIAGSLLFFHFHGLPIQNLFSRSHAFGAVKNPLSYLSPPSPAYFWGQFNLLFLLSPCVILLIPLLVFRRIPLHPSNTHLLLASLVMGAFQLLWRAKLGVYEDWNLFAAAALTFSLLVWSNAIQVPALRKQPAVLFLLWAVFSAHSLAWILSNHFLPGWA